MIQRPGDLAFFPPMQKEGLKEFAKGAVQASVNITDGFRYGLFSNGSILSLLLLFITKDRNRPKTSLTFKEEYDYVIVGGGSAGSVLASRLSELPCVSVLLLEAGQTAPLLTDVPSMARLFYESDIDWNYRTTPQKHCAYGMKKRQVVWPMGKVLGGSSVLNAMMAVRGNKKNFDKWEAMGAKGWSFKEVLPYFLKMEDFRDYDSDTNWDYHSVGGPLTLEKPKYHPEIKDPLLKAAKRMGYKIIDPNAESQTGFTDLHGTLRNGKRCSTAKAYLVPAENRTNLDILTKAFVRKIILKNKRAIGVEFDFKGRTRTVKARREVIISAGAVNSPQILLLSGIGPAQHLREMEIPVIADLPVGLNLHDHVCTNVNFLMKDTISEVSFKGLNPINMLRYFQDRSGPNASTDQVVIVAFIRGLDANTTLDFPLQELHITEFSTYSAKHQMGITDEVFKKVYGPYEGKSMYTCFVHNMQPKSRGSITLKSLDPYEHPNIDPNYYAHDDDLKDIVEGMKVCHKLGTSKEMKEAVGSKPFGTLYPGCEEYVGDEDKLFACHAKSFVQTFYHPAGTTKMGDPDDPTTVVDPELRVKSINGLRVICVASMPIVTSGNTNLPTIMMAEKASDMIKRTIKCNEKYQKKTKK